MIRSTEKYNFIEAILNSSKLGLIRLSVYNSVFNVNRRKINSYMIPKVKPGQIPVF